MDAGWWVEQGGGWSRMVGEAGCGWSRVVGGAGRRVKQDGWWSSDVGGARWWVGRNGGWSRMVHKFYFWLQLLGAFPPPYWWRDLIAVISLAVGRSMSTDGGVDPPPLCSESCSGASDTTQAETGLHPAG